MTKSFKRKDGKIIPNEVSMGDNGPDARIVILWQRSIKLAELIPNKVRLAHCTGDHLDEMIDVLNETAGGADYEKQHAKLISLETKLQETYKFSWLISEANRFVLPTFFCGAIILLVYRLIFDLNFVDWLGPDHAWTMEIVEGFIGATGYGLIGMAVAQCVLAYCRYRFGSSADQSERVSASVGKTLIENIMLILATLFAIYAGLPSLAGDRATIAQIIVPMKSLATGFIVGLSAEKIMRTLIK